MWGSGWNMARALTCSRILSGRWTQTWDVRIRSSSRKVLLEVVHIQVGNHDSVLQLLDVKVRGRTLGAENIDIVVVSGEFCNVDPNGFKLTKRRTREMSYEVPNVNDPIGEKCCCSRKEQMT